MTLAEVIDTLQTWIEKADDEYDREEMGRVAGLKEALHEIKKIELCEDAISRAEVLSHAKTEWGNGHEQPFDYVEVDVIKQLPPVTPTEKVGHWIKTKVRGGITLPCCSLCGNETGTIYEYGYCPNCGCRMQETKE